MEVPANLALEVIFVEEIAERNSKQGDKLIFNNFEDVLDALGGFGRFQLITLVLLLSIEIPCAFVAFVNVFIAAPPQEFTCLDVVSGNDTSDIVLTGQPICECNGSLVSYSDNSIISEWMLICDQAWVSDFITSIQMFGMLVGNIYGGSSSDWYGRKYTCIGAIVLMGLGQVLSVVAFNPYVYAVGRFAGGAGFAGCLSASAVYMMEFCTPKWRQLGNSVGPWGEGIMLLPLLAYFIRPWRDLLWATLIPYPVLLITIIPFIPESPRWLLRNNRVREAHEVTKKIARFNGKREDLVSEEDLQLIAENEQNMTTGCSTQHSPNAELREPLSKTQSLKIVNGIVDSDAPSIPISALTKQSKTETTKEVRYSYMDMWRNVELRMTTVYLMTIWFSWAITYFGISYNIKNVKGDPYWNVVLLGLTDAVGYPASYHITNKIGRRKAVAFFMSWATFFLVSLAILEIFINVTTAEHTWLLLSLCLLGKFGVSGVRGSCRTLSGESYPTNCRSMGCGLCGVAASLGGIAAPQLAFLGSYWPSLPYFVFAIISIIGAAVSLLLQETMGEPLKEIISNLNPLLKEERKLLADSTRESHTGSDEADTAVKSSNFDGPLNENKSELTVTTRL